MRAQSRHGVDPRAVLVLAWPVLVGMLSFTVMGVVDSLFVARLGTEALAAVGLASSANHVVVALPIGILGAVRVLVAQRQGANSPVEADQIGVQGLWLATALGLGCTVLAAGSDLWIGLLGGSDSLIELGGPYVQVRLLGSLAVLWTFALQGWFHGREDTQTPMVGVLLANVLNLVLNPILIFGLGLGVGGAGLATALCWILQAAWLFSRAGRLWEQRVGPQRRLLGALVDQGLPMGTHQWMDVLSYAVFARLLVTVGEVHLAAHLVVVRILMMSFLPGNAIADATGVLVGRSVGAGDRAAAHEAWTSGATVVACLMGGMGVLFLAAPGAFVGPFALEPAAYELAVLVLRVGAMVQVVDGLGMVSISALNAAGDTRWSMLAGLFGTWAIKLPLAAGCILGLGMGLEGAWLGVAAEMVVIGGLTVWRVRRGHPSHGVRPGPAPAVAIGRPG